MHCPECGAPETHILRGHRGDTGPGEQVDVECTDCGEVFVAVAPEPPERD